MRLRVDARNGYSGISDACFKDDFRTQLLDHFDFSVEAALRNPVTKREMLGSDAHDDGLVAPTGQCLMICRRQSEAQGRGCGDKAGSLFADLDAEEVHRWSTDEACDKFVRRVAIDLERGPGLLNASIQHHH